MNRKLTIFTIMTLLCISGSAYAAPMDYNGSISVESKTIHPGQSFVLRVLLSGSDVGITSLRVPLKFDSDYLTCTYVDFGSSILDASMQGYYSVDGDVLDISYIPSVIDPLPEITAASGEIASIYFTLAHDVPVEMLFVDSSHGHTQFDQFGTTFHQWRRIEATDQSGLTQLIPSFIPAMLQVDQTTAVGDDTDDLLPDVFELEQNYPNPFNPVTSIGFSLPVAEHVKLEVFNLLGQVVATLADDKFAAGYHTVEWDAGGEPSGVYFYRISAETRIITRKMMLLK